MFKYMLFTLFLSSDHECVLSFNLIKGWNIFLIIVLIKEEYLESSFEKFSLQELYISTTTQSATTKSGRWYVKISDHLCSLLKVGDKILLFLVEMFRRPQIIGDCLVVAIKFWQPSFAWFIFSLCRYYPRPLVVVNNKRRNFL